MTKPFLLEDKSELQAPMRKVHTHAWSWAQGGLATAKVLESESARLLVLRSSCDDPQGMHVAGEFLQAIVEYKLEQGWSIQWMDGDSAVLMRSSSSRNHTQDARS